MPLRALLLAASCAAAAHAGPAASAPRRVAFATSDGWTIAADYRPPRRGGAVLILVHGVGASKAEWSVLAERLAARGVGTLALDLRGHADSRKGPGGEQGWEGFDAAGEWPNAGRDLDAAAGWLAARGIGGARVGFGGGSIGANLAARAAAARADAAFLLLLSPGPEYRGVELVSRPGLKTLAVASTTDPYAAQTLGPLAARGVETLEAPSGHGARLLDDPATLDRVAEWVARAARRVEAGRGPGAR
jgi:alpha-beta hydrolase superfamily lysophospholipase